MKLVPKMEAVIKAKMFSLHSFSIEDLHLLNPTTENKRKLSRRNPWYMTHLEVAHQYETSTSIYSKETVILTNKQEQTTQILLHVLLHKKLRIQLTTYAWPVYLQKLSTINSSKYLIKMKMNGWSLRVSNDKFYITEFYTWRPISCLSTL